MCPIRRKTAHLIAVAIAFATVILPARADNARFDLTGPEVEVHVTRGGVTLPIASVPNLQVGDRLWLHPDLPATQSVRYLMVLAFLRGTTNPPPDNWFIRIETWDKKVRQEGVEVTVPDEAQQAVLFLAPVTGGDFSTLRSAVQGRPGIFVRAAQDLAAAGFEQARIERYIESMRQLTPTEVSDPKQLQEHSNQIAATLALKPNGDCVKLPPDQQYTCLTQSGGQTLLDDGHGQSIVDALSGGASAGLIGTASTTQLAGGGVYSAYVGTVVDLVHVMGSLHTAQYQYIPAIAFPQQQALNLRLNVPPSFHNPKSVIVVGLPLVEKSIPPPLRASDPKAVSCLAKPGVVLPVEGAPLVFSTGFAHDLTLHINYPDAGAAAAKQQQDIPLTADAFHGGLVLAALPKRHELPEENISKPANGKSEGDDASAKATESDTAQLTGTIQGLWGFDPFTGPTMPLQDTPGKGWHLTGDDPLIAGKDQHVEIASSGMACIQSIALTPGSGKQEKAAWKAADKPDTVDVALDVPAHDSGKLQLAIRQFGDAKAATVNLVSYNEPVKMERLGYHAGDMAAMLMGSGLDQVKQVEIGGAIFKPANAAKDGGVRLVLASGAKAPALHGDESVTAQVSLDDGRTVKLSMTVEAARPSVALIGRADVPAEAAAHSAFSIKLASADDLPVSDALMFSLKSAHPFSRAGRIEVASPDGSLHSTLSVEDGSLVLEDPQTVLATLKPQKVFGPSAFGPIRVRAVAPDGTAGEWLPLVTLVRLPTLTGLSCPSLTGAVAAGSIVAALPAPAAGSDAPESSVTPAEGAAPSGSLGPVVPTSAAAAAAAPGPAVSVHAVPVPATATTSVPAPAACTLSGGGLYFLDSVASTAAFSAPARVPDGFVGSSIAVPTPTGEVLYLKLRDDPAQVDTVSLPAGPLEKSPQ